MGHELDGQRNGERKASDGVMRLQRESKIDRERERERARAREREREREEEGGGRCCNLSVHYLLCIVACLVHTYRSMPYRFIRIAVSLSTPVDTHNSHAYPSTYLKTKNIFLYDIYSLPYMHRPSLSL
jgi:hypothetical protein